MLGNSFTSANNMPAMLAEPEKKLLIVLDALNVIKDALDDITFEVEHKELDHAVDLVERAVTVSVKWWMNLSRKNMSWMKPWKTLMRRMNDLKYGKQFGMISIF